MKGKKASRAPKERINVVYRPAAKPNEPVELPLKFLVVADLRGKPDDTELDERAVLAIDEENFDEVMGELDIGVDTVVPDTLTGDPSSELPVNLKFKKMRDFTPGGIARQVPELKKLLELREALSALKSPLGNKQAFRTRIKALLEDEGHRKQLLDELGIGDGSTRSGE